MSEMMTLPMISGKRFFIRTIRREVFLRMAANSFRTDKTKIKIFVEINYLQ